VSETCSRAASDLGLKIFALQTFSTDMITYIKQEIKCKSQKLLQTHYNVLQFWKILYLLLTVY
jgi:hypothetical protein